MGAYLDATRRRVTIQYVRLPRKPTPWWWLNACGVLGRYVLLAGVNDQPEHADALAQLLERIGPANRFHVNLIPYNPQVCDLPMSPPSMTFSDRGITDPV